MILGREAERIVQRMHQELPFAFTETPRLTWLNYRWFLTTRCTVSEKTSAVLYWRHSQQTTAAFRSWQLPVPSPHHPILSRGNRLSPSGVFCNKHPSKTGFSSAFFKLSYVTVSYRASYFKALMLTRKLAAGCQRSCWHCVTLARCWPGRSQCGGHCCHRIKLIASEVM